MQQSLFNLLDEPAPGEYPLIDVTPSTCRSCGQGIAWAQTSTGRPIPLDISTIRHINGVRYAMNHFATCPDGIEWRRRR